MYASLCMSICICMCVNLGPESILYSCMLQHMLKKEVVDVGFLRLLMYSMVGYLHKKMASILTDCQRCNDESGLKLYVYS